ncbi:hypothetical protein PG984_009808 [Apiospora sp. TS-2023a]
MSSVGTTQSATAVGISFPIIDAIAFCMTGCCAGLLTGVFNGAFSDAPPIDPDDAAEREHLVAQVTAALVILWMGANFLIKLVMLLFYRRIFVGRAFNIVNWVFIGLSIIWFIYAVLSWLFYCGTNFTANVEGGWQVCPVWGFQIQMGVFALDSFIDLSLLIMPIPFVWRLQMDFKRKIAITVVFILGGFAFVAGLNNTIIQIVSLTEPDVINSDDGANFFQGSSLLFSNWPAIEVGVGLLAANLPTLSFQFARAVTASLPEGLRISIDSIRRAAARLSLSSRRESQERRERTQAQDWREQTKPAESRQHLSAEAGSERRLGSTSMEQSSACSADVYELRDLSANRTGAQAV